MHKHKWDYRSAVGRTGAFRCLGCRALVSLLVCPALVSGFTFTLRVVAPGSGVSGADLDRIGRFCSEVAGTPSAITVEGFRHPHRRIS